MLMKQMGIIHFIDTLARPFTLQQISISRRHLDVVLIDKVATNNFKVAKLLHESNFFPNKN